MTIKKTKNNYFLCLLIAILFIGCNVKDPFNYHGQFNFYQDNNLVTEPFSPEIFEKLKSAVNNAVMAFGFVNIDGDNTTLISSKTMLPFEEYRYLKGSDANLSFAICNDKNYVLIMIHDRSYNYETEFFIELKQTIISSLKTKFGFSDVGFKEVGVFILNN